MHSEILSNASCFCPNAASLPAFDMDDTAALQECGDLSLEIDELSPATQMFLSSSPSLQIQNWQNVTPTLSSSQAPVQAPSLPLPPPSRRSTIEPESRAVSSSGAQAAKSAAKGHLTKRAVLDRGKPASNASRRTPRVKALACAAAADGHRDSAEFFEKSHGGLLSPPPALPSSDFPIFPADNEAPVLLSANAAAPVCTPQKIEAKHAGRQSKLLRPSPNVSLFSGSKRNDRNDPTADASPRTAPPPPTDPATRAIPFDLASVLHIGPSQPVPAPPSPLRRTNDQPLLLPAASSSDSDFLQIQQFLHSRSGRAARLSLVA